MRAGGEQAEAAGEITDEKYTSLTTKFKDGCKALCEVAEVKENAAKLQRAFFVLVVDTKIHPKTMTRTGEMQCITQLFGDPAASAIIQNHTKPISETEGWEAKDMIR